MDPKVIGIVGASQRKSRGTRVLEDLINIVFEGPIYPINPRYASVPETAR